MRLALQWVAHAGRARQFVRCLGIKVCRVAVADDRAGVGNHDRTRLCRADDRPANAALEIDNESSDRMREFAGFAADLVIAPARRPTEPWSGHRDQQFARSEIGLERAEHIILDGDRARAVWAT